MRALQDEVSNCMLHYCIQIICGWHYLEQHSVTRDDGEQAVGAGA